MAPRAGLCARVRACAGAAESLLFTLYIHIHTMTNTSLRDEA